MSSWPWTHFCSRTEQPVHTSCATPHSQRRWRLVSGNCLHVSQASCEINLLFIEFTWVGKIFAHACHIKTLILFGKWSLQIFDQMQLPNILIEHSDQSLSLESPARCFWDLNFLALCYCVFIPQDNARSQFICFLVFIGQIWELTMVAKLYS